MYEEHSRGHGRIEYRRIWATGRIAPGKYINFPHASQVFRIESTVTGLDGTPLRENEVEVRYGITSLSTRKADKRRLLELARGHWSIENKLHYVRDVTYDEDRSRVRRGAAPHMMASISNLAISLLRMAGATNIAEAGRHCTFHPEFAARLLGVSMVA